MPDFSNQWNPIDLPVDRCFLGGYGTPGLLEVSGAGLLNKWDELAGVAMTGAILRYMGRRPSRFTLRFKLLTGEHWQQWAEIRPVLTRPPINKNNTALDVDHPVLNEVGITHLVVEELSAPEQVEDGVWQIEVKCIEWRRFGMVPATPIDAAAATPFDPREAQIQQLLDEHQQLVLARDRGNP